MRPSRRVVLLTVVAVSCGALLTGVTLLNLRGPDDGLTELEDRVIPAIEALDRTAQETSDAHRLYLQALGSEGDTREALFTEAQLSTDLNTEWRRYRSLAYDTPSERALQFGYLEARDQALSARNTVLRLLDSPDTEEYQAALTRERGLFEESIVVLEAINRTFYLPRIRGGIADANEGIGETGAWVLGLFGGLLVIGLGIAGGTLRGALRDERALRQREREREVEVRRSNIETQLQRGLEMEPTEESTYEVIGAALKLVRPDHPVELLVADSSRAHFRQVHSTDERLRPGCPVPAPLECPATSSGQTRSFLSSARLDACPFLRSREEGPLSATCVPVSIAGVTTGVIHTTGPDDVLPDSVEALELELVARKAGDRIGFLRVLARTETQARIDVLTGLFNRRSLEQQAREVVDRGDEFVVAFADLDHFKELNDKHGHEMGDRALRLFGRVLRDSVRPADIPSRFGGEEFVVVLPDCTIADARLVAERVRERLQSAVAAATVPPFTVSIGLTAWEPGETFGETVSRADAALLLAKSSGRDQVLSSLDVPRSDLASSDASSE